MNYSKKGAMFGLDARIALAIFGALSVISGAALYSAIQDSKVTAIVAEMDNIGKATTAYYLDTGIYPAAITGAAVTTLDARQLTASSQTGWEGPYLPFEDGATARMLDHPIYTEVSLHGAVDAAWSDVDTSAAKCLTTTPGTCSVFVCYTGVSNDMQSAVDVKVDGADDDDAGNVRYNNDGSVCMKALTFPTTSAVN